MVSLEVFISLQICYHLLAMLPTFLRDIKVLLPMGWFVSRPEMYQEKTWGLLGKACKLKKKCWTSQSQRCKLFLYHSQPLYYSKWYDNMSRGILLRKQCGVLSHVQILKVSLWNFHSLSLCLSFVSPSGQISIFFLSCLNESGTFGFWV